MSETPSDTPQIRREDFLAYETVILSGQIPHEAAARLMQDNPRFAAWYRQRADARAQRSALPPRARRSVHDA